MHSTSSATPNSGPCPATRSRTTHSTARTAVAHDGYGRRTTQRSAWPDHEPGSRSKSCFESNRPRAASGGGIGICRVEWYAISWMQRQLDGAAWRSCPCTRSPYALPIDPDHRFFGGKRLHLSGHTPGICRSIGHGPVAPSNFTAGDVLERLAIKRGRIGCRLLLAVWPI